MIMLLLRVMLMTSFVYSSPICSDVNAMYNRKCESSSVTAQCDTNWYCPRTTYWVCLPYANRFWTGCIKCPQSCPTGQYLSASCDLDTSPTNTIPTCSTCSSVTCVQGEYIAGCTGKQNRYCAKCTACTTGYYNPGCVPGGTSNGTCVPCKTCKQGWTTVPGTCSGTQDAVCTGGYCDVTSACVDAVCSFTTQSVTDCGLKWTDFPLTGIADPLNFLCLQSTTSGTCQMCPIGWRKEDEYCVPCQEGFSCNEMGVPVCEGQCEIGSWATCDYTLGISQGYVTCHTCNQSKQVKNSISHAFPMRSGVVGRDDSCNVYMQCDIGYYLGFVTFGVLQCMPCMIPEAYPGHWVFMSYGVTFGDKYSCLYDRNVLLTGMNPLGFYGNKTNSMNSCPLGSTSQTGMAKTIRDCVLCTNAPTFSVFELYQVNCAFKCNSAQQTSKLGLLCENPDQSEASCDTEKGFHKLDKDCVQSLMPWNQPGYDYPTQIVSRVLNMNIEQKQVQFKWIEVNTQIAVDGTYIYNLQLTVPSSFCIKYQNAAGLQDIPLFSINCHYSSKEFYDYYMVYTHPQSRYFFAFLERKQGYNNRYIMWKITRTGTGISEVRSHYKLPGRVCSVTSDYDYTTTAEVLFVSFCNTSWVSFYHVGDNAAIPRAQYQSSPVLVGRFTGRVMGQATTGNVDGLREQALFKNRLWIGTSPTRKGHLYIADELNCRLVNVWMDYSNISVYPASFLNYAATIGESSCYDVLYGLSFPRLLTIVYQNMFLLFLTNKGVYQMDVKTHTRTLIISNNVLPRNITQLWANGTNIQVHNLSHTYHFSLISTRCPPGSHSREGVGCMFCPLFTYSNADRSLCLSCTPDNTLQCGIGFSMTGCTLESDAQCVACPPLSEFSNVIPGYTQSYLSPGSCADYNIGYTPPCPPGYYVHDLIDSNRCTLCPTWSSSGYGSYFITSCQCHGQGVMDEIAEMCVQVQSPFNIIPILGQSLTIPDWFVEDIYRCSIDECLQSGGQGGCFLESIVPRKCSKCPENTVSTNQLWCEYCPLGLQANMFQDMCVCIPPSFPAKNEARCMCPVGHYFDATKETCLECRGNTIQLEDTKADLSSLTCTMCPDGQMASQDHSQCVPCPLGEYRVVGPGDSMGCVSCGVDVQGNPQFAPDPASATCISCVHMCSPGLKWEVCPGTLQTDMYYNCVSCGEIQVPNAHYVSTRTNHQCMWECDQGYYYKIYDGGDNPCTPCVVTGCEPGYVLQLCSKYEDGNCNQQCMNQTMPRANAHYTNACMWECKEGYVLQTKKVFDHIIEHICQ